MGLRWAILVRVVLDAIRDSQGEIVRILVGPIGIADSTKAEVMGLLLGLRAARDMHLKGFLVEGDSLVVVGWGLGLLSGSWKFAQLVHEIRELMVFCKLSWGMFLEPRMSLRID